MKLSCALVTGASSGIGWSTAQMLAREGLNLVLLARRSEKLEMLKQRILTDNPKLNVDCLEADVRDRKRLLRLFEQQKFKDVDVLINNAGLARGVSVVQDAEWDDWEEMIDTNVKGLFALTRILVPQMIQQNRGHVVNLGSVAGRWAYRGGSVYCATKFAVRAFSESLRQDLLGTAIRVTNIEPGLVETEFSEVRLRDKAAAKKVYEGISPLTANDIAETIVWSLKRPPHVNIQELVVFPTDQAAVHLTKGR